MNEISVDVFNEICRICLVKKVKLKNIFEASVPKMLMECASVHVSEHDKLPSNICMQCLQQVNRCYSFKQLCEKSETVLKECLLKLELENKFSIDLSTPTILSKSINDQSVLDIESESSLNDVSLNNLIDNVKDDGDISTWLTSECIKEKLENDQAETKIWEREMKITSDGVENSEQKKPKELVCNVCKKTFKAEWKLLNHTCGHTCVVCSKPFSVLSLLKRHMRTHAANRDETVRERRAMKNKPFQCEICYKKFLEQQTLKKHIIEQHQGKKRIYEKKHMCNVCGKRFCNKSWLEVHTRKHTGERPLTCEACGKTFYMPSSLTKHMLTHEEKKYKCGICEKYFTQSFQLTVHMRTHTGEKPYVCSVCGKGTTTSEALTVHMRTHSGEKPFRCNQCDNAFASRSQLTIHLRRHLGQKPYSCPTCGRCFLQKGDLDIHIRYHTGERRYACKVCPKTFFAHSALRVHTMGHTGQKPYRCTQCDKRFVSPYILKTHLRTHTGEKPFVCKICGNKYSQSGSLSTHMKRHNINLK